MYYNRDFIMWVLLIPIALIFFIGLFIWSVIRIIKGPKIPFFFGYPIIDTKDIIPEMWRIELNGSKVDIFRDKEKIHSFDVLNIADICARHEKEPDKIIEKEKNMLLRAVTGGLLLGNAGIALGAISALKPTKKVIKGKEDTYIIIALRNGQRFYLKPALGYEYGFNDFCKKFRIIQRLGVAESSVS